MNEGSPINYDRLWADYQRSLVNLYRALGGDWTAMPPNAATAAQAEAKSR